jgi:two-component system, chemotaxis family, sensor kinase Cph1
MEYLIDSLLYYSRLGRSELATHSIDLNLLVQEVVELFKMSAGNTLEVIVHPLPMIQGDRTQMSELFTNLVSNAIKYNDNPVVKIEIGCLATDLVQHVGHEHLATDVRAAAQIIYVRDNGIGINPIHFDDIFRIFKRLHVQDEYGGGTGAGLTIAQKIVERHGGKMWVESDLGDGSTFYFTVREE